jgi:HK97 family phage major capsid protein
MNIKALRQRKADLWKANRALLDSTSDENGKLNEADAAKFEVQLASLKDVQEALDREEKNLDIERSLAPTGGREEHEETTTGEKPQKFARLGEQLIACVRAEQSGGRYVDPRFGIQATGAGGVQAAASGMSEAVPSDGGFLVQKDFSAELLKRTYESGQISSRVRRIPISSNANGIKINAIDEVSRADGSRWGGILAYWVNEADTLTATKPKFRRIELNLQKLIGLCYATDELLQDAAALEAVIMEAFPEEFTFKVEDAIMNGTGAGQPLGFTNSGAVITVTKDGADSGATVSTLDILAMWSRMWPRSRQSSVWLINQDVEPKLYPLTLGSGTAVQLLYTPPGQNGNQYGKLLGRDVIPTEHNATLGTPGDIILADLSQYIMIDKGAPQAASSLHVRFLNDEMTFRFTYRCDGQATWNKVLTPKNGSNTLAPFINLSTRS